MDSNNSTESTAKVDEFDDVEKRRRRPKLPQVEVLVAPQEQPPEAKSSAPQIKPIELPQLEPDYAKLWADHWQAEGGDPREEAVNLDCYISAVEALERGDLKIENGVELAKSIRDYASKEFRNRVRQRQMDNVYHSALLGFLYRVAVERLRSGDLPGRGANAVAADVIEAYVDKIFVEKHFA